MKVFAFITLLVTVASAEPPVPSNRYLPSIRTPTFSSSSLSTSYGTPLGNSNLHANNPAISYDISNQYTASSQDYTPSSQYGAPTQYVTPSFQYGAPSHNGASSHQLASSQSFNPSTQYGVPSTYNTPSAQYGAPSTRYNIPSTKYGVPSYSRANFEEHSEPANYNFQYDVQEHQSGADFGHAEARQGENTQGRYYVTLPDGKKQTVDYTADENGFKPQISYQQTNNGYSSKYSGYSDNGGYVNGGYQNNYQNGY